jgi:hypothetical protein
MKIVPIPPRDPKSKHNPQFVKLLKGGLDKLWNGRKGKNSTGWTHFICNTFYRDDGYGPLQRLIESRLDHRGTFQDWAKKHGRFTAKQIQEGRRAWILDLIEEFS